MPSSCCSKPMTRIIKVGSTEAGLVGLDAALSTVHQSGLKDDEEIKNELLHAVRRSGNYIAGSVEQDYKIALLREYREFVREHVEKR